MLAGALRYCGVSSRHRHPWTSTPSPDGETGTTCNQGQNGAACFGRHLFEVARNVGYAGTPSVVGGKTTFVTRNIKNCRSEANLTGGFTPVSPDELCTRFAGGSKATNIRSFGGRSGDLAARMEGHQAVHRTILWRRQTRRIVVLNRSERRSSARAISTTSWMSTPASAAASPG